MNENKRVGGERQAFVNYDLVEKGYQRLLNGGDMVAQAATLERRGGPCPLCGREFAKVEVDNRYGKFTYYQPSCTRCYPVCRSVEIFDRTDGRRIGSVEGCGRHLITERILGIDYCTQCYSEPPGTHVEKEKQYHRGSYRERY